MENKIGFFQDDVNSNSISRVIIFMFACLTVICTAFSFYQYGYVAGIATFSSMSTIVLAGKAVSKSQEAIENKIEELKPNK